MKVMIPCLVLLIAALAAGQSSSAPASKSQPERLITYCANDGYDADISGFPIGATIARIGDVKLQVVSVGDESGADFRFVQHGKPILDFALNDLLAPEVWIAVDFRNNRLALTYSDGGGLGGFHVRIFQIGNNGITDISGMVAPAVRDFKSRHYCESRGNNVRALKWIHGDLLLMTSVYPTSDCGAEMGHTEAYLVGTPSGNLMRHLTLQELKHYPGVCLQNDGD